MNDLDYQKKINNIITKCPIEAGVEILVYQLLDSILDPDRYALVDIDRIWKNRDSRLTTSAGIPDIAVLPPDFIYRQEDTGNPYGFIEVKTVGSNLPVTAQIEGQKSDCTHYIYTNGLVWNYFKDGILQWTIKLIEKKIAPQTPVKISSDAFDDLVTALKKITWN